MKFLIVVEDECCYLHKYNGEMKDLKHNNIWKNDPGACTPGKGALRPLIFRFSGGLLLLDEDDCDCDDDDDRDDHGSVQEHVAAA